MNKPRFRYSWLRRGWVNKNKTLIWSFDRARNDWCIRVLPWPPKSIC
jgi:hypothetical protein